MQFLLSLYTLWWFCLRKVYKAMVDYQLNMEGWLEDATLFPTEPNDYNFNLDDLLNVEKANTEVPLNVDLPDLQWLDEKINLSFFDDPKGLLIQPNEAETLMLEDATNLLFDLIESDPDTSCLPSNDLKVKSNNDLDASASNIWQYPCASPSSSDFPATIPSPYYKSISEASSPASIFSDIPVDSTSYQLCASPGAMSTCSGFDDVKSELPSTEAVTICENYNFCDPIKVEETLNIDKVASSLEKSNFVNNGKKFLKIPVKSEVAPIVSVTICKDDIFCDPVPVEETLTIEEVTSSVKKRKYVNDGKKVPKVQVSLKNVFHPYSKASSRKKGDRNERKKVQNKEAAARYRMKKRSNEVVLSGEVAELEAQQTKLQDKHDDLLSEIKYLKSLMREMFQKKGLL